MTSNVEFAGRAFRPGNFARRAKSESDRGPGNLEFCVGGAGAQQIRTLKTGESLFLQGDEVRSICVLRDGWAFRYQCLEDGRRQIVDFILPGDVLGIGPSAQMVYGVEALSPCTWMTIPRECFFNALGRQPALSRKLVDMLSASQSRAFDQMTSLGRRTARERVAHLLLDLARRVRRSASACKGIEITMPLMLSHIGDALGLATETVCRCLGELKRGGILVFSAGQLEILDMDCLSELAGTLVDDEVEHGDGCERKRLVA